MNIIWDFDGVLLDSEPIHLNSWIYTIRSLTNMPLIDTSKLKELENFNGRTGKENSKIIKEIFNLNQDIKEIHQLKIDEFKKHINRSYLNEDALFLFAKNKNKGGKNYLASGSSMAKIYSKEWGIEFDGYINPENLNYSKPNPEIFLKCINEFGLNPSETIVIEDSYNGISACEKLKEIFPSINFINYKNREKVNPVFSLRDIEIK